MDKISKKVYVQEKGIRDLWVREYKFLDGIDLCFWGLG